MLHVHSCLGIYLAPVIPVSGTANMPDRCKITCLLLANSGSVVDLMMVVMSFVMGFSGWRCVT